MTTCPYCKDSVAEAEAVSCPACDALHHVECWEANGDTCSVFGCKSSSASDIVGCPWCDEVYVHGERSVCMICNAELMGPREFVAVIQGRDWVRLQLPEGENPGLTAGYLRSSGISARVEKRPPISMLLSSSPVVFVPREEEETARLLLDSLERCFFRCPGCGHILMVGEECSYCEDAGSKR